MALLLETPANHEVSYLAKDLFDGPAELERRHAAYPNLDLKYIRIGAPIIGPSGHELFNWALKPLGLQRSDLFIENVLHCWPPRGKTGNYPIGDAKKIGESLCTKTWNRLDQFGPTAAVVNFHPAALLRDVTPLPMQIRAFERAKWLMSQGHKVVVCCGGKAAKAFLNYAENVTRWCSHWAVLKPNYMELVVRRLDENANEAVAKASRAEAAKSGKATKKRTRKPKAVDDSGGSTSLPLASSRPSESPDQTPVPRKSRKRTRKVKALEIEESTAPEKVSGSQEETICGISGSGAGTREDISDQGQATNP